MLPVVYKVSGVPYGSTRDEIGLLLLREWTNNIVLQTRDLPKVQESCVIKLTFLLPRDKFPDRFPYGPDLNYLINKLIETLKQTLFSDTTGKDACIYALHAVKKEVQSVQEAGVIIDIKPYQTTDIPH